MAEYSYNGWHASRNPGDFGGLTKLIVAGESFAPGVRSGDVHTVMQYVAEQLHARVEPVVRADWHQADDWGFSYRQNRNANNLSCHSSGTAFDYNATRHPNGKAGTFSAAQVAEIHRILDEVDNVVRWGGDFTGTKDEMHFEIKSNQGAVAMAAQGLGQDGDNELDKRQAAQLDTLLTQMTGSAEPWTFLGWDEGWVPGGPNLTVVDLCRRVIDQNRRMSADLNEVHRRLDNIAVGNVDYALLAKAVADEMSNRMVS